MSTFWGTLEGGPQWISVLNSFLYYAMFLISDGLLVSENDWTSDNADHMLHRFGGVIMCGDSRAGQFQSHRYC